MISLVVYGRNDSYGYNLHKRAALSLNCMAEMLADDDDEIIFVDYNSPNDHPTFPEAIRDTLTQKVRRKLRILRVRPRVHERYRHSTPLPVLEAIARNVGIRRSRSTNRWILSTNTDMIFVSLSGRSLTEIARDLPRGLYHAPRIEVPETLWESLDRTDPRAAIEAIESWGRDLHLNEIVRTDKVLYDGPGDFQLIDRHDLHANQGFHEGMLLGWHLDSNLAIRTKLLYGAIGDLGSEVFGYHCDHTRQLTLSHGPARLENSWARFIDGVERPDIPEQAETWGCAGEEIEDISLISDCSTPYIDALRGVLGAPLVEPIITDYKAETYDKTDYSPAHVLPFLMDLFVNSERTLHIGWIGSRSETLELFVSAWRRLGFVGRILLPADGRGPLFAQCSGGVSSLDWNSFISEAECFVVDFGRADGASDEACEQRMRPDSDNALTRAFLRLVRNEQARADDGMKRREIACLNTANTSVDRLVQRCMVATLAPFGTRLRHGLIRIQGAAEEDWSGSMQAGDAGLKDGSVIRSRPGAIGLMCHAEAPSVLVGPSYALHLRLTLAEPNEGEARERIGIIELFDRDRYVAHRPLTIEDLRAGETAFSFSVPDEFEGGWLAHPQLRIRIVSPALITLESVVLRKAISSAPERSALVQGVDWLSGLLLSPWARWTKDQRVEFSGAPGRELIAFGPYWMLPPGRYAVELAAEIEVADDRPGLIIEVVSGERYRAETVMRSGLERTRLTFEVHKDEQSSTSLIEVRLRAIAATSGRITAVRVRRISEPVRASPWIVSSQLGRDWLPHLLVGGAGTRSADGIAANPGASGVVAFGPFWDLPSGAYSAVFEFASSGMSETGERTYGRIDTAAGGVPIASAEFSEADIDAGPIVLGFMLPDATPGGPVETRVFSDGASFTLRSVRVEKMSPMPP
jgi:hypothetical protein